MTSCLYRFLVCRPRILQLSCCMMASFNTCSGLQLAGVSACTDVCSSREVDAPGAPPPFPLPRLSLLRHTVRKMSGGENFHLCAAVKITLVKQCSASLSSCLHLSHEVAQYLLCLRFGLRTMQHMQWVTDGQHS